MLLPGCSGISLCADGFPRRHRPVVAGQSRCCASNRADARRLWRIGAAVLGHRRAEFVFARVRLLRSTLLQSIAGCPERHGGTSPRNACRGRAGEYSSAVRSARVD